MFEDESGHRPGDWSRKRYRQAEKTRQLAQQQEEKPQDEELSPIATKEAAIIAAAIVLIWPLGLALLWRSRLSVGVKAGITAAVLLAVAFLAYPALKARFNWV